MRTQWTCGITDQWHWQKKLLDNNIQYALMTSWHIFEWLYWAVTSGDENTLWCDIHPCAFTHTSPLWSGAILNNLSLSTSPVGGLWGQWLMTGTCKPPSTFCQGILEPLHSNFVTVKDARPVMRLLSINRPSSPLPLRIIIPINTGAWHFNGI